MARVFRRRGLSLVWVLGLALGAAFGSGTGSIVSLPSQSAPTGISLPAAGVAVAADAVSAISAGENSTCALKDGGVWCWGYNPAGPNSSVPFAVGGLQGSVSAISAGYEDVCGIKNGAALCWGNPAFGQLGNGTGSGSLVATPVVGLSSGVTAISAGQEYACAIKDGNVWCWGLNDTGQLGATTTTACGFNIPCSLVPIEVTALPSGVIAITAGLRDGAGWAGGHTCALTTTGGVWCWGSNFGGALGATTSQTCVDEAGRVDDCSTTPLAVPGFGSGVTAISAGAAHTCALKAGGAWCWGRNDNGQLGNNSTIDSQVPVAVSGLASGVSSIRAGWFDTCAIVNLGAKCWGGNAYGQLGNKSTNDSHAPVGVWKLGSGVTAVDTGTYHTCAIQNGTAWCWGWNYFGQLGNNSTTDSAAPVLVLWPGRYLALGDSVPYGHGLVNPTKDSNEGPSRSAYPSLVATALGYRMHLRPTGCTLVNDNLAVSGAASGLKNTFGNDDDCPNKSLLGVTWSTLPHKAVDPDELAAANFKSDPPALVTIQVGANDVNFVECMKAELGVPGSESCMARNSSVLSVSSSVRAELTNLEKSLDAIVGKIEKQAPSAKIAVVNYYQIAPKPNTTLVDDHSLICSNWPWGLLNQSATDRQRIYDDALVLQTELNKSIARVKNTHPKVVLVDIASVFDGRELCTQNTELFTDDGNITTAWRDAHPTAEGHKAIASLVESAVR